MILNLENLVNESHLVPTHPSSLPLRSSGLTVATGDSREGRGRMPIAINTCEGEERCSLDSLGTRKGTNLKTPHLTWSLSKWRVLWATSNLDFLFNVGWLLIAWTLRRGIQREGGENPPADIRRWQSILYSVSETIALKKKRRALSHPEPGGGWWCWLLGMGGGTGKRTFGDRDESGAPVGRVRGHSCNCTLVEASRHGFGATWSRVSASRRLARLDSS